MKILRLVAENIKKLKAVEIKPDGSLVQITGPNGSGKSSVLDAIYYALAGASSLPSLPVRQGEEKASIRLELGEVTVIRRFTAAGGTSLVVETAEGARYPSPQKLLDDLLGALTFDPLEFTRMSPAEQLETLKKLVRLDVDVDALEEANVTDYNKRTTLNRKLNDTIAAGSQVVVPEGTPDEPISIDDLVSELESAGKLNSDLLQRTAGREKFVDAINFKKHGVENISNQIEELQSSLKSLRESLLADEVKLAMAEPLPQPIDTAALKMKIQGARGINEQVAKKHQLVNLKALAGKIKTEVDQLSSVIEERKSQKQTAIAAAKMPVDGLSFGEKNVVLNGIPFSQASSAEQLRVSVAIAMSANPKLRILRIQDGSLLDDKNLQVIAEMAQAGDYQVWIERVDTSGKVGIVMEDGEVKF